MHYALLSTRSFLPYSLDRLLLLLPPVLASSRQRQRAISHLNNLPLQNLHGQIRCFITQSSLTKTIGCLGCKHKFLPLMHLITNPQQPRGSEADNLLSISQLQHFRSSTQPVSMISMSASASKPLYSRVSKVVLKSSWRPPSFQVLSQSLCPDQAESH